MQELRERTNYRIVTTNDGTADATLTGTITSVFIAPLTYDSVTGRISSSLVVVAHERQPGTGKVGKVLWSNPNFLYREQYQESMNAASFFEEASAGSAAHGNKLRADAGGRTCWRRSRCGALLPPTALLPM